MAPALSRALFGCVDRDATPEVVLLTRLIAIAWLLTGHALLLGNRSVAFFPGLQPIADSTMFAWGELVIGFACAVNLILGRRVRASAVTLGLLIFATTLLSRGFFSNNRLFTACVLVLAGLAPLGLLRVQVVFLYFAAGADKLLDPAWRSGAFVRSFARGLAEHGRLWSPGTDARAPYPPARAFAALVDALPAAARAASFATIAIELALAALFLAGARRAAIALGLLFHVGLLVYTGSPMGMFFYSATAAYLAFVTLPTTLEVAVPPRWQGPASALARVVDPDGRVRVRSGSWHGVVGALAQLPAFYVFAAVLLAGPWFVPALVLALLPLLAIAAPKRAEVGDVARELNP